MANILIVPDKFKGTLTAQRVAEIIRDAWLAEHPEDTCCLLPMADGGDGFGEVFGQLLGASARHTTTVDAAGKYRRVRWWLATDTGSAVFEAAEVNGLALMRATNPESTEVSAGDGPWDPLALDTTGLAKVLLEAAAQSVERMYVGIGGSATNDGGFGVARALGWQFFDVAGGTIENWKDLYKLDRILPPECVPKLPEIVVAVDVDNPLCGPSGATYVYGPQKGLRGVELAHAEACLQQLAHIVERDLKLATASEPGAGAAGGLGYGLRVFAGAKLQSGAELFARLVGLDEHLAWADLVVSAEGAVDAQSLMGKGVGYIVQKARELRKPCSVFAGVKGDDLVDSELSCHVFAIVPELASREASIADPEPPLAQLVKLVARRASVQDGRVSVR